MVGWPRTREELTDLQRRLAAQTAEPWPPPLGREIAIGAVFAAFSTRVDPSPSERAWVAAVIGAERCTIVAAAEAPYEPGYLALREGRALERAVRGLAHEPDVLLVDATGRDHPRGAGLALHLGAVLGMPTVGVTDRPLVARPDAEDRLLLGGREVGRVVVTRAGARPADGPGRPSRYDTPGSSRGPRAPGTRDGFRPGGGWTRRRHRGPPRADPLSRVRAAA